MPDERHKHLRSQLNMLFIYLYIVVSLYIFVGSD